MTLNPKNRAFGEFFLQFLAATHILRVNCAEMAGDGPGKPGYDIFSIEHTFLRILSFDLLNSRSLCTEA